MQVVHKNVLIYLYGGCLAIYTPLTKTKMKYILHQLQKKFSQEELQTPMSHPAKTRYGSFDHKKGIYRCCNTVICCKLIST